MVKWFNTTSYIIHTFTHWWEGLPRKVPPDHQDRIHRRHSYGINLGLSIFTEVSLTLFYICKLCWHLSKLLMTYQFKDWRLVNAVILYTTIFTAFISLPFLFNLSFQFNELISSLYFISSRFLCQTANHYNLHLITLLRVRGFMSQQDLEKLVHVHLTPVTL